MVENRGGTEVERRGDMGSTVGTDAQSPPQQAMPQMLKRRRKGKKLHWHACSQICSTWSAASSIRTDSNLFCPLPGSEFYTAYPLYNLHLRRDIIADGYRLWKQSLSAYHQSRTHFFTFQMSSELKTLGICCWDYTITQLCRKWIEIEHYKDPYCWWLKSCTSWGW